MPRSRPLPEGGDYRRSGCEDGCVLSVPFVLLRRRLRRPNGVEELGFSESKFPWS